MSVSALIEDLLAREVERLDPHGGKFGVKVREVGRRHAAKGKRADGYDGA